jgi:hypothetical protein
VLLHNKEDLSFGYEIGSIDGIASIIAFGALE